METELISSQIAIAYATSSILEWLKGRSWFPFMQDNASSINRFSSIAVAFFTAIGIHWVTDWQADNGVMIITITGLTWGSIGHGLIAWIQQFAFQQASYKMLVKSDSPVKVAEVQAKAISGTGDGTLHVNEQPIK